MKLFTELKQFLKEDVWLFLESYIEDCSVKTIEDSILSGIKGIVVVAEESDLSESFDVQKFYVDNYLIPILVQEVGTRNYYDYDQSLIEIEFPIYNSNWDTSRLVAEQTKQIYSGEKLLLTGSNHLKSSIRTITIMNSITDHKR